MPTVKIVSMHKWYKCLVTSAGDLSPSSTAVLGIKPAPGPATPICLRTGHAYTPTGAQGEVLTMTTRSQGQGDILYSILYRVHKSPYKFMLTSYMKYFAKFLALLLHNTSFFHFYFIFHTS